MVMFFSNECKGLQNVCLGFFVEVQDHSASKQLGSSAEI